jgi:hypothetical protein
MAIQDPAQPGIGTRIANACGRKVVGAKGFEAAFAKATARPAFDPSVPNRPVVSNFPKKMPLFSVRLTTG